MSVLKALWIKLKEVFSKMLSTKTVASVLNVEPAISNEMIDAIELWCAMYEGKAPWLHEATDEDPTVVKSLGLPQLIASEKARTALLEFKSEISGSKRADFLNEQYKKVKKQIRKQLEYGLAKGDLVIKPYVQLKSNGEYEMSFDYVQADNFYPLAFNGNDELVEAAFIQRKVDKDVIYTRVEHHKIVNGTITVKNLAFKQPTRQGITDKYTTALGNEIQLTEVPEWAELEPEVTIDGVDRLLFAYFRTPEANNIDTHSPLGVSCFDKAKSLIEEADKQFSRLLWEFEGGELAIDIDRNALQDNIIYDNDGNILHQSTLGKLQERLYRKVDLSDDNTYNVFSPTLRDASLINGLNNILQHIEDACSLSRGTISDINTSVEKTATELKIMKNRSFQANAAIQSALEETLRDLVYVMDVYADLYNIIPKGEYDISFEWDDSILVDMESELATRLTLVDKKIISKVELRMWYFGETEEQAIEALAKIENSDNTIENKNGNEEIEENNEEIEENNEETTDEIIDNNE